MATKHISYKHGADKHESSLPTVTVKNMAGSRLQCTVEVQLYIVDIFKEYLEDTLKIGYADPAVHGSLSDQLLWVGSNKLFERFGKHPSLHCGGKKIIKDITIFHDKF